MYDEKDWNAEDAWNGENVVNLEEELLRRQETAAIARADAFLARFRRLDGWIDHQIQMKEYFQTLATRTTRTPVALPGGGDGDDRSRAAARAMDLEREIDALVDQLWDLKNEIWCVLGQMENQDIALILDDLYLMGKTVGRTAKENHFGERYVYKLRRAGLLQVDRILAREETLRGYGSPRK